MQKKLNLSIELDDDHFVVGITEPESGEYSAVDNNSSPDEHPEFDSDIGAAIYEWLALWCSELWEAEE